MSGLGDGGIWRGSIGGWQGGSEVDVKFAEVRRLEKDVEGELEVEVEVWELWKFEVVGMNR